jgi:hypothetical protein
MGRVSDIDYLPATWESATWDEGDVAGVPRTYLFEFNAAGDVLRQIELAGPQRVPVAAASLAEFWETQEHVAQPETPAQARYRHRYGLVAEGRRAAWDANYAPVPITRGEFEAEWEAARASLDAQDAGA